MSECPSGAAGKGNRLNKTLSACQSARQRQFLDGERACAMLRSREKLSVTLRTCPVNDALRHQPDMTPHTHRALKRTALADPLSAPSLLARARFACRPRTGGDLLYSILRRGVRGAERILRSAWCPPNGSVSHASHRPRPPTAQ